jgi:BlaI family penicillinase repressor
MARRATEMLTERESQIMAILWDLGEATADQVREGLGGNPHDSSVRTILRVLHKKGCVHLDRRKRPIVYRPSVSQSRMQQKAAKNLLQRFFGGSAEALVLRLMEDEYLTKEQLGQLKKIGGRTNRGRKT